MTSTLTIESFAPENIKERSQLLEAANASSTALSVLSTAGYGMNDILYVGSLGMERCEKVVVASVESSTQLTLKDPLQHHHNAYDNVASVVGDNIRTYRALGEGGRKPADDDFVPLGTRQIDSDSQSTYYRDTNGTADHWYKFTYTNLDNTDETSLADAKAVRGQGFGNYCSLREIREEAGFLHAQNLKDTLVEQCRSNAQNEINSSLRNVYGNKVPFDPVPGLIKTLTIKLAAAYLLQSAYPGRKDLWKPRLKEALAQLTSLQNKESSIGDDTGESLVDNSISFYPGPDDYRAFGMNMRF